VQQSDQRAEQINAALNSQESQSLAGRMGITILEASPERVVATMPVEGNTQPYGILHGIEINATHHRAARSGLVTGVATLLHGGRTMSTFDIAITDEDGKRVCTARLSCLHRDGVPGEPKPA
jgi:1,4-dihydroxy-2-naphthoyl-CoA hydrolase